MYASGLWRKKIISSAVSNISKITFGSFQEGSKKNLNNLKKKLGSFITDLFNICVKGIENLFFWFFREHRNDHDRK